MSKLLLKNQELKADRAFFETRYNEMANTENSFKKMIARLGTENNEIMTDRQKLEEEVKTIRNDNQKLEKELKVEKDKCCTLF